MTDLGLVVFVCMHLFVLNCQRVDGIIREVSPHSSDYAVSQMTPLQKQNMLDEHNRFRSMVRPTAANMEYQEWSDDLANLAQMWTNRCTWSHGFVKFGDAYPRDPDVAKRSDQLGQNLAREYGGITNPETRVERWYNEYKYYRFSKFQSPMGPSQCIPRRICGHYTQLAWALSRHVGCGMTWCNKKFDSGYHPPNNPGETLVNCDYSLSGNVIGHYPYKTGKACSKCVSGKGWCYQKLCRACKDYSPECGKEMTTDMCNTDAEKMKKYCPKMCNVCECPLSCVNGGTLIKHQCRCVCPAGWRPPDCSEQCKDKQSKTGCKEFLTEGRRCDQVFMQEHCPSTCGICDDGTGTGPAIITSVPTMPTVSPTQAPLPSSPAPQPTTRPNPEPLPTAQPTSNQQSCTEDDNPKCSTWASEGECEWNRNWMMKHCCASCNTWKKGVCKDTIHQCPLWAADGDCEKNREWMLTNCRVSCNQCKACQDLLDTCPDMALQGHCKKNPLNMLTQCRRSCGLCKVYDKEVWCPAWSAKGSCYGDNWPWMFNNCPRSCDVPLSSHQYCATKPDGFYSTSLTCKGYIQCLSGATKFVACPAGYTFEKYSKICRINNDVECEQVNSDEDSYLRKKSKVYSRRR